MIRASLLALLLAAWPWSTYKLTVVNGTGSGVYKAGQKTVLSTVVPPGTTVVWLSGGPLHWGMHPLVFSDARTNPTVYTMQPYDDQVQATFVAIQ